MRGSWSIVTSPGAAATAGIALTAGLAVCAWAAGVSKALFFFYFPSKEDALLEAGVLSTRDARRKARDLVTKPYDLTEVIIAVLTTLERTMRPNPPELLIEVVLEGNRAEPRPKARRTPTTRPDSSSFRCCGAPSRTASFRPTWMCCSGARRPVTHGGRHPPLGRRRVRRPQLRRGGRP
jgi:hypothetical protein